METWSGIVEVVFFGSMKDASDNSRAQGVERSAWSPQLRRADVSELTAAFVADWNSFGGVSKSQQ